MASKPSSLTRLLEHDLIRAEERIDGIIHDIATKNDSETHIPRLYEEIIAAEKRAEIYLDQKETYLVKIAKMTRDYSGLRSFRYLRSQLDGLELLAQDYLKRNKIRKSLNISLFKLRAMYSIIEEHN